MFKTQILGADVGISLLTAIELHTLKFDGFLGDLINETVQPPHYIVGRKEMKIRNPHINTNVLIYTFECNIIKQPIHYTVCAYN